MSAEHAPKTMVCDGKRVLHSSPSTIDPYLYAKVRGCNGAANDDWLRIDGSENRNLFFFNNTKGLLVSLFLHRTRASLLWNRGLA